VVSFKYAEWLKEHHPKLHPKESDALKLYFNHLETTCASSTVISIFSSIRKVVKARFKIDIIDMELTEVLKRVIKEHKFRKSLVFEEGQVEKFLIEASEVDFGYIKLIWCIGYYGGLRKSELYNHT